MLFSTSFLYPFDLKFSCNLYIQCSVNFVFLSGMLAGALRRWYNPPWFSEQIPSTPYDPLALREAFEKACSALFLFACLNFIVLQDLCYVYFDEVIVLKI